MAYAHGTCATASVKGFATAQPLDSKRRDPDGVAGWTCVLAYNHGVTNRRLEQSTRRARHYGQLNYWRCRQLGWLGV